VQFELLLTTPPVSQEKLTPNTMIRDQLESFPQIDQTSTPGSPTQKLFHTTTLLYVRDNILSTMRVSDLKPREFHIVNSGRVKGLYYEMINELITSA
jgi:hypothetical protein